MDIWTFQVNITFKKCFHAKLPGQKAPRTSARSLRKNIHKVEAPWRSLCERKKEVFTQSRQERKGQKRLLSFNYFCVFLAISASWRENNIH
jgi:hypothetical protein